MGGLNREKYLWQNILLQLPSTQTLATHTGLRAAKTKEKFLASFGFSCEKIHYKNV